MEHFSRAGLVFDVSDEGPDDGESVVLLHGWPQDHTAWRHVAPLLHAAGLRTLAPDQRGYSPGARPRGRAAYGMGELVADAVALLDAAGVARAHVVGHDWGGSVAWALAERHPERVSSLTVLSTPHHHAMGWAMRHGDQLRRSWYMFAFQLPLLPEAVLRRRLPAVLRRSGLPEEDVLRYAARFRQRGAATSCLAWYRGMPIGAALPRPLQVWRRQGRARPTSPQRRITVPRPTSGAAATRHWGATPRCGPSGGWPVTTGSWSSTQATGCPSGCPRWSRQRSCVALACPRAVPDHGRGRAAAVAQGIVIVSLRESWPLPAMLAARTW